MFNHLELLEDSHHWSLYNIFKKNKPQSADDYDPLNFLNENDPIDFEKDVVDPVDYDEIVPGQIGRGNYVIEGVTNNSAEWGRQDGRIRLIGLDNQGFDTMENEVFGFDPLVNEIDINHQPDIETPPTSEVPLNMMGTERKANDSILQLPSQRFIDLKNQQEVSDFIHTRYGDNYKGFDEPEYIPLPSVDKARIESKREAWKKSIWSLGKLWKNGSYNGIKSLGNCKLVPRSSLRSQEEKDAEMQRLIDFYAGEYSASEVLQRVELRLGNKTRLFWIQ